MFGSRRPFKLVVLLFQLKTYNFQLKTAEIIGPSGVPSSLKESQLSTKVHDPEKRTMQHDNWNYTILMKLDKFGNPLEVKGTFSAEQL